MLFQWCIDFVLILLAGLKLLLKNLTQQVVVVAEPNRNYPGKAKKKK
jgi:hypothetical protein